MTRRMAVRLLSLLAVLGLRSGSVAAGLKEAAIGDWRFSVPDDWELKDNGSGASYLEAKDGTRGCYIKDIKLKEPRPTAEAVSRFVQSNQEQGFPRGAKGNWRVMERTGGAEGALYRSSLDMYDRDANYRVLSLVLASSNQAVQLTIHDYLCTDYARARHAFDPIARSLHRAAGAA